MGIVMRSPESIRDTSIITDDENDEKRYRPHSYWVEKTYTTPENIVPQKTYYKYVCHACNNENMVLPLDTCYKCLFKMTHIQFLDGSIGEVRDCSKCKHNTDDKNIGCNRECCDPYTGRHYPDWKPDIMDTLLESKQKQDIQVQESKKEPVVEEDDKPSNNSIEDYMTELFTSTINI